MKSEYTESVSDLRKEEKVNDSPRTNTFVFGILLILMQIAIGLLYGFLVWLPPLNNAPSIIPPPPPLNTKYFEPIIITIILFFMVVLGFGAIFAYERKLVWSALGFNLLIVCLTIEWFFLMYLFWLKADILKNGIKFKDAGRPDNDIWLTANVAIYSPSTNTLTSKDLWKFGGCLTQAIKCALANCIAFSAILGRAGPLQAFFISWIGTFGFEINRFLCLRFDLDFGGTYTVFVYGGFMSLIIGILLRFKQPANNSTQKDIRYTADLFSGAISFFGACMLFAVFPILTQDSVLSVFYYPPDVNFPNGITIETIPSVALSVWYSMASSVSLGYAVSTLINGKVVARDFINSLVAGGVAACSASLFFTNPVWPMVLGSTCGIVQALIQRTVQQSIANSSKIFHTYSFTLFGVQGFIGAVFGSIFRRVIEFKNDGFNTDFLNNPGLQVPRAGYDLAMAALAAAFGIGFGLVIGLLVCLTTRHERQDNFDDYTYWIPDDGIRYPHIRQIQPPTTTPFVPIIPIVPQTNHQSQIFVKESNTNVKAKHAYL